jgi:Ca-activated chloride channel family protein
LARFLERELTETAKTRIERASARLRLPRGLSFVRALGAEAQTIRDGEVLLKLGSLFGGDERRVVIELRADASLGDNLDINSHVSWSQIDGQHSDIELATLALVTTDSAQEVDLSKDSRVWASCMSALASTRQLDAAAAYARGDVATAQRLIEESMGELDAAAETAPDDQADRLREQKRSYQATKGRFATAAPGSAEGRAAAKEATAADNANLSRDSF